MITICVCGQTACFIKRIINQRKNHIQITLSKQNHTQKNNNSVPTNKIIRHNSQRWNDNTYSITGNFLIIICILVIIFSHNYVYRWPNLNEEEKMQLKYNYSQLIFNVFIPIGFIMKNKKLFKHLKTEIYG